MLEYSLSFNVPMLTPLGVAYAAVFILSLLGNVVVLLIVARNSHMRSMIDLFICNLSTADILSAICVLPMTFLQSVFSSWVFGQAICKSIPYLQGVTVGASIMTLTVVAFDRYMAICHPLKRLITKKDAKVIIFVIWVIACGSLTPWAINFTVNAIIDDNITSSATSPETLAAIKSPNSSVRLICYEDYEHKTYYFVGWIVFGLYVLPLILITLFYSLIADKIWNRVKASAESDRSSGVSATKAPLTATNMLRTDGGLNRKKTVKIVKMLVVVVVLFGLSRLPFYVYVLLDIMVNFSTHFQYFTYVLAWLQWLQSSNCCVNPWVYCLYSKKYRAGFKTMLLCMASAGRRRRYTLDNTRGAARSHSGATSTFNSMPLTTRPHQKWHGDSGDHENPGSESSSRDGNGQFLSARQAENADSAHRSFLYNQWPQKQ